MRTRTPSFLAAVAATLFLFACGGGDDGGDNVDARRIDAPMADAAETDAPNIDAQDVDAGIDAAPDAMVDAPIDAMPTPSESIGFVRAASGAVNLPVTDVTVTYIKPVGGNPTNDPAGFTVQAEQNGPAVMIAVDPADLTPVPVVGDVVSFTVTNVTVEAMQPRATAITGFTRSSQGADVGALAQDVSAATDLVTALGNYDSEIIDVSADIAAACTGAGTGFEQCQITTAGITAAASNFTVRLPATLQATADLAPGCAITLDNTPVHRFGTSAQLTAFVAADLTVSNCPAPIVVAGLGTSATTVNITFSRNIDPASVMADGSQFTFDNNLTASAASVDGKVVTLTTSVQANGTMYTATVANTIMDTYGTALGTPDTATFTAFMSPTHLVINEVDYNQLGNTDTNSFIEIYNPTPIAQPLANLAIAFVNGNGNTEYRAQVALSDAASMLDPGAYLVIRNSTVVVPGGTLTIDVAGDFMQNGPDAIALIDTSSMSVVDALSYGSPPVTTATIAGVSGTPSMVEGTAFTGSDPNDDLNSVERVVNGLDTNNAVSDWAVRTNPSPGAAN